jgi:hypothetical protein
MSKEVMLCRNIIQELLKQLKTHKTANQTVIENANEYLDGREKYLENKFFLV